MLHPLLDFAIDRERGGLDERSEQQRDIELELEAAVGDAEGALKVPAAHREVDAGSVLVEPLQLGLVLREALRIAGPRGFDGASGVGLGERMLDHVFHAGERTAPPCRCAEQTKVCQRQS